jgi:quinol monooxygenase YgiN
MSVNVVVHFNCQDGKAEQLRSLLRQGRDVSREAEGCQSFELYQRQDQPNRFSFSERWASIEAHHQNMAINIMATGHMAKIMPLLVGPPDNGVVVLVD